MSGNYRGHEYNVLCIHGGSFRSPFLYVVVQNQNNYVVEFRPYTIRKHDMVHRQGAE